MNFSSRKWLILTLLIKALLSIISIYAYQSIRFVILLIMIIWFLIDIVVYRVSINLIADIIAVCIIVIIAFPSYDYMEEARFSLFGNRYMSKVEDVLKDLNDLPDSDWAKYDKDTIYVKHGNSILVYFPTNISMGSGYVYFSDSTARDFWEHPSKYNKSAPDEKAYIKLQDLSDKWAYIVIFK